MKTTDSIRKFLILNSVVVYGFLLLNLGCLFYIYKVTTKGLEESREYIYSINTEGEIIPMKWVNRRENIEIEAKAHLQYFVKSYYDLNLNKWEKSINKAAYLANIENLHIDRQNKGYYNKFIQFDVIQKAELYPENIEIDMQSSPYKFRILINISEIYGSKEEEFQIFAKGEITVTDRNFPNNPFGLWINNYLEEAITKIEE